MHDKHNLLSRMENKEPQPQHLLLRHQAPSLLSQLSEKSPLPDHQPLSLLTQMDNLVSLQGLPLNLTQESITMYSLNVTPLLKHIERGISPKQQYMSKSRASLPEHSVITGGDQTQLLDCSLRPSRAMIWKLKQQQAKEEQSTHCSTPPALLY